MLKAIAPLASFGVVLMPISSSAEMTSDVPTGLANLAKEMDHRGTPLNTIVKQEILPQLDFFFDKLNTERKEMSINDIKPFTGNDRFLPGKIALGLSYLLVETPQNDSKFSRYLQGYREIADLTVDERNETWGIYYYLAALNKLHKANLLEIAVNPATLAKLQTKLDWRTFVREPEFSLIDLPTNYYGVAFSIARLRMQLGWESASASEKLLAAMLGHYKKYSSEYGFSDETEGEGRFDRYSILLVGEICQRFIETGMEVTPQLKGWLRKSVDAMLVRLNPNGEGFDYGRSIGVYADTAFLEVLSAAAYLGILNDQEKEMAYAFATRVAWRYVDFWFDPRMRSVNLWEGGRRTDAYRGKNRILGENLSLTHQHLYTNEIWNRVGFRDKEPSAAFESWLDTLPRTTVTWFARGEYDRALVTYRDGSRIISLPLVNGGSGQHMNTPYFPIPFSNGLLAGSADADYPQLIPKFTLADGSTLMPLAFIRHIEMREEGDRVTVSYRQEELDRLGVETPIKDGRLTLSSEYLLAPGTIMRTDRYVPVAPLQVERIELEFASFSDRASVESTSIRFAEGGVYEFTIDGLRDCRAEHLNNREPYQAPIGPMMTLVTCQTQRLTIDKPLTIQWILKYR